MDEKEEKEPLPYNDTQTNYDEMTDDEYYREMEKKVEFYKKNYPDMYKKAEDWIKMLDHSEVYRTAQQESPSTDPNAPTVPVESQGRIQANDILKNMKFHGLNEDDMTEKEKQVLQENIPDWKNQLEIQD